MITPRRIPAQSTPRRFEVDAAGLVLKASDRRHLVHSTSTPTVSAEKAAEVFVVRQHCNSRESATFDKRLSRPTFESVFNRLIHAFLLVQEPLTASNCNLPGIELVLEVADHRGQHVIVDGINVI